MFPIGSSRRRLLNLSTRSSAFIFSAMSVGIPARLPLSISTFLTHSFRGWGANQSSRESTGPPATAIHAAPHCREPAAPHVRALQGKLVRHHAPSYSGAAAAGKTGAVQSIFGSSDAMENIPFSSRLTVIRWAFGCVALIMMRAGLGPSPARRAR